MADEVLKQLRNELIGGLSEAVISTLLDDLRGNVLGKEEIEVIEHKMKTRSDQARCLIDCNKVYKMDSNPCGLCVIVNNEDFGNPKKNRNGSQNDVVSLKDLFESLGFLVEVEIDKTADEMKALMTEYSQDKRHGDCFVCCVMSHGNENGVKGCDGQKCTLNDITTPFDGDNCPALIGKPKVFIIQACRGSEMQSKVVATDGAGPSRNQTSGKLSYSIAKDSDFLIALSTVEGYVSLRDPSSGSWFIQSLCKHLKEGSEQRQDILGILTNVNDDVSRREDFIINEKNDKVDAKMTPQPKFTLRKLLIFKAPKKKSR
ncbi:caspase-22 isoform X2 [Garra rufa]|uniref:caspase-22 isoform X2 n=1 Tax=Garra rufa TaxID=137080 RepID=UPI003CCEF15B